MRQDVTDVGEQLRNNGWRQGSILDSHVLAKVIDSGASDCAVVVSQDCDIVRGVEIEPCIEIILASILQTSDLSCLNGRNPRRIQLQLKSPSGSLLHLSIHDRSLLGKELLSGYRPSETIVLDPNNTRTLADWIAKRYTRPAWPDEFSKRLDKVGDRLDRLFKHEDARVIIGLWLDLDPRYTELAVGQEYTLHRVWLTMTPESRMDSAMAAAALRFETRLRGILDDCPGVRAVDVDLKSEADVTLNDLRVLQRLDRDYRSLPSNAAVGPGGY